MMFHKVKLSSKFHSNGIKTIAGWRSWSNTIVIYPNQDEKRLIAVYEDEWADIFIHETVHGITFHFLDLDDLWNKTRINHEWIVHKLIGCRKHERRAGFFKKKEG